MQITVSQIREKINEGKNWEQMAKEFGVPFKSFIDAKTAINKTGAKLQLKRARRAIQVEIVDDTLDVLSQEVENIPTQPEMAEATF